MLEIKNIYVSLGNFSLQNISFQVEQGDYLTLLGLSGAGKTVILEVLAGLTRQKSGQILLNGTDISHQNIQRRSMGLVYQDMALFPHMKVSENIMYALNRKKLTKKEKSKRLQEVSELTHASNLLDRYPETLSGGEAQRVALARTLASDPQVLLLDEPLASMDVKLKDDLRKLLGTINKTGKTIIHVTHDYTEAATLSNKVAIIDKGKLVQWGEPTEVFQNPVSEFVARFSGVKNIFSCRFQHEQSHKGVYYGITSGGLSIYTTSYSEKEQVHLIIPGEEIIVSEKALKTSALNQMEVTVKNIWHFQHFTEIMVQNSEEFFVMISQQSVENLGLKPGKKVWISFKASSVKII